MSTRPQDFSLFKNYSIGLKDWLERNCYISNLPNNNNVNVVYSSIDRAWINRVMEIANGQNTSANINFTLSNYEYLENENILGFVTEQKINNKGTVNIVRPPLVYSLTYKLTLFTRLQSEMDMLVYQIVSRAHKHAKAVIMVDGQFCEFMVSNPSDETNLEPGEIQDRVVRFGIELRVKRAYLPIGYEEAEKITTVATSLTTP
jgi:hypothetical protein